MRAGFRIKINCKVLIFKTNLAFLTLHVYLIPSDPALQQIIKSKELSSGYKMIKKPNPQKSLKMGKYFTFKANMDSAEITPEGMYEEELARLRPELVRNMSRELINQLLDDLLMDGVLNDGEKDSVLQENDTRADRARCLIDMVKRKGRAASRKIICHIQSRDPTLSADLGLHV
ncbi:hypothetical protein JOQ06_023464 [Pogonophryne albipinna]|uniref:CARD domain-containing protein n=1 Tax=Pogonophryne albipinna TaxID=1090488 RepID=A0AAD6BLG0_9TELE|nr:hypothetical protein JOQ06_023464 [Pogonophryne albipinna]